MTLVNALLSNISFTSGLSAFLTCSLIYTALWILYCRTLHPLAKIPGPLWASVTRLWYMKNVYGGNMAPLQRSLHKRYGNLVRIAPNEVSSANPADIPLIYRERRPFQKTDFYPLFTEPRISKQPDLFSALDETFHAQLRRTLNSVYTLSNILRNEVYIATCTNLFIQRLGEFADEGKTVNLGRWTQMFAYDVLGELFFGKAFGFMEKQEDHQEMMASLDAVLPLFTTASVAPTYYRPLIFGSSVLSSTVRRGIEGTNRIKEACVEATSKRKQEIKDGSAHRYDLLQQLMDIANSDQKRVKFGTKEVTLEAWVAMFAGSETTAVALSASLYYLIKNPSCLKKLEAELSSASHKLSSPIKYTESQQLPYLCSCVKKAMRLCPSVVGSMARNSPKGGIVISSQYIPEGFRIAMNNGVVFHNECAIGPDVAEYKPERWLDTYASKLRLLEPASSLVFGGGTRVCSGKNIALTEI